MHQSSSAATSRKGRPVDWRKDSWNVEKDSDSRMVRTSFFWKGESFGICDYFLIGQTSRMRIFLQARLFFVKLQRTRGDKKGDERAGGHDDGGEERGHFSSEAEGDGTEIVSDGKGENSQGGLLSPAGGGKKSRKKIEAA